MILGPLELAIMKPNKKEPVCHINEHGNKYWVYNDKLHREDGPAIEWHDGSIFFYVKDKLHRLDGPAIERSNGSKFWYYKGRFHRENGPAVELTDGHKVWYFHGREFASEDAFIRYKQLKRLKG